MNDDTTNAATTIAHCQDCDSTVHVVHRPHKVMSTLMFTPSAAPQ
jgi:hypothetical protein